MLIILFHLLHFLPSLFVEPLPGIKRGNILCSELTMKFSKILFRMFNGYYSSVIIDKCRMDSHESKSAVNVE